jgi:hypothetical protein
VKGNLVHELAIGPSDELYLCGDFHSITTQGRQSSIKNLAKYPNGVWQKVEFNRYSDARIVLFPFPIRINYERP